MNQKYKTELDVIDAIEAVTIDYDAFDAKCWYISDAERLEKVARFIRNRLEETGAKKEIVRGRTNSSLLSALS